MCVRPFISLVINLGFVFFKSIHISVALLTFRHIDNEDKGFPDIMRRWNVVLVYATVLEAWNGTPVDTTR